MNQQSNKNLERLALHPQETAIAAQLPSAQVSFELSEADDLRIGLRLIRQHIRATYEQKHPHLAAASAPCSHFPPPRSSNTPAGNTAQLPKTGEDPHNASFQAGRSAQEC